MKEADRLKPPVETQKRPLLVLLSGPSGVGKDSVLSLMKASRYPIAYITTITTRSRRPNERQDIDYHFVTNEDFKEMLDSDGLLESAKVYGNWYGVPKDAVRQAFSKRQDVMLKVDIQGVDNIKKIVPQAVTIFLTPASLEELEIRLKHRHTESAFDLSLRLKIAESEMARLVDFDYAVLNREGELDQAVSDIKAIITAEKCRVVCRDCTF